MSIIVIPNTFSAGATIIASQHNSNFSTIYNDYNGNIDNNNISASAAIAYSKLNLVGTIVNADVSTSAAIAYSKLNLTGAVLNADLAGLIADSKLSTISTAGKVSGAALTSLSSIPSGAGVIPTVNLPSNGSVFISATPFSSTTSTGAITISNSSYYKVILVANDVSAGVNTVTAIFNADGGSNYKYSYQGLSDAAGSLTGNSSSSTSIQICPQLAGSADINFFGIIMPRKSDLTKRVFLQGKTSSSAINAGGSAFVDVSGQYTGASNIISFAFNFSANATGTVYLYSVAIA